MEARIHCVPLGKFQEYREGKVEAIYFLPHMLDDEPKVKKVTQEAGK